MNRPVYAGNEPLYTERYVQWCEKTGVNHPLLLDYLVEDEHAHYVTYIAG